MKPKSRLVPSKSLAKDQLIHKPVLRKNTIHLGVERLFGNELTNYTHAMKENISQNISLIAKKTLSKSICPKPRMRAVSKQPTPLVSTVRNRSATESQIPNVPENVREYFWDVQHHLTSSELSSQRIDASYLVYQKEITPRLRENLVCQLVELHQRFRLLPQTLFKAVNLMDQYLNRNAEIQKRKLELLGLACLFISTKYEQIYPPSMRSILDKSGRSFSSLELIDMEGKVLKQLDFDICTSTASAHLQSMALQFKFSEAEKCRASYLSELLLYKAETSKFHPVEIAIACGSLAKPETRQSMLTSYGGVQRQSIEECEHLASDCFSDAKLQPNATRSKYCQEKYLEVGKQETL